MKFNVSVFNGTIYSIEKRNLARDSTEALPEGTMLLHSEVVIGDDDAEFLEVWVAIPQESILSEQSSEVPDPAAQTLQIPTLSEAEDVTLEWELDEDDIVESNEDYYE